MAGAIAPRRGGATLLVGAVLALGIAACGDDEETDSVTIPTLPTQITEEPATTDEATSEGETTGDSGGVSPGDDATEESEIEGPDGSGGVGPADDSGGRGDPARPDSAENDIPPEPGSPQEAFEQYCDQNPGACD